MGRVDGVVATRVGFVNGVEAVQCVFDRSKISMATMVNKWAESHEVGKRWANAKYASAVFTADEAVAKQVSSTFGSSVLRQPGTFELAKDADQLYYLKKKKPELAMKGELSPLQLTKINSAVAFDSTYENWLQPIDGDDSREVVFKPMKKSMAPKRKPTKPKSLKVVLLGDEGVGKTSLIDKLLGQTDTQMRTTGIPKPVRHGLQVAGSPESQVALQVWDRCGARNLPAPALRSFYRDADAGIFVYDITRPETLNSVSLWMNEFIESTNKKGKYEQPPLVIVGTRADLASAEPLATALSHETVPDVARRWQPKSHHKISLCHDHNVANDIFSHCVQAVTAPAVVT
eukprot:SAG31_NODE_3446_length_4259_cov_3.747115_4_plen_345_part_00